MEKFPMSGKRQAEIISDLGKSHVSQGDPVIWPGFRIFKAATTDELDTKTRAKRKLNSVGNPCFDYTVDTVFDYATILAHKMGNTDWRPYNRLCSVHVPKCSFDCWHCYNDAWPQHRDDIRTSAVADIEDKDGGIVRLFLKQREFDRSMGKQTNVLRITGGEPFSEPEMVLAAAERMARENDSIRERADEHLCALWTETNLTPFVPRHRFFIQNGKYLDRLVEYRSCLVIHPCFHGLSDDEVKITTGTTVTFSELMDAFERIVRSGIDVYPTIHSNLVNPTLLKDFFKALVSIDSQLPLRVALIEIDLQYQAVRERMKRCQEKGRIPSLYSRHATLYEWNRLIEQQYGFGYGVVPRHLIRLGDDRFTSYPGKENFMARKGPDISQTRLLLLKSSARDAYRVHLLTMLGLPNGILFSTQYDTKWIAQDIACASEFWPELLKCDKKSSATTHNFYSAYIENIDNEPVLTPIRTGRLLYSSLAGTCTSFLYELGGYPALDTGGKGNVWGKLSWVFGEHTLAPKGNTFAVLSPAFTELEPCPSGEQFDQWDELVNCLSKMPGLGSSLFCRLRQITSHKLHNIGDGIGQRTVITCGSMERISFSLKYRMPNFERIVSEHKAKPVLRVQVAGDNVLEYIGPEFITLSKYDEIQLDFKAKSPDKGAEAEIRIWREDDPGQGPEFRIPVRVTASKKVIGNFLLALFGAIGTACTVAIGKRLDADAACPLAPVHTGGGITTWGLVATLGISIMVVALARYVLGAYKD